MMHLEAAGLSDIGRKRRNNEDSFGYNLDDAVFVVCDGMGGMAAGELASELAVNCTLAAYRQACIHAAEPEERLHAAIVNANSSVWQASQSRAELRGMGTTLVAACVGGNEIVIGNVGDSRAYFVRDGICVQITEDHSLHPETARGGIAHSQAWITRAIGASSTVEPDFFVAELQSGDTVLLATDGLTRYVDTDVIASHVGAAGSLVELCHGLVTMAHAQGAEDNVTCLLLRAL